MSGFRFRVIAVAALVALFAFFSLANFVPEERRIESPLLPDSGLRLGLDLQGGIHWVLGVKLEAAIDHELEFLAGSLTDAAERDGFEFSDVDAENQQLAVAVFTEANAAKVREWAGRTGSLVEVSSDEDQIVYALSKDWTLEVEQRAMSQVLEVLRRRIDDPVRGIPDSVVTRQGTDRVLIQIPGGQIDRSRAREIIKVTGFLEFKIVNDTAPSEELLLARHDGAIPDDSEIIFERDKETQRVLAAYLVPTAAAVTGDYLTDARVGFDRQQRPIVEFQFDAKGGKIFSELTAENINERLAIILDEQVYSAPNIQSRIGTRGQITGRFTMQEAADLAVVLRAGSLSVPVVIEEERTVGPALGADSIDRGVKASVIGLLLIVVFSIGYYRMAGVYASIALAANLFLLIGIMSLFGATLTLPGFAGLVLTVGMAVDANVIIFERIREELRAGKLPRAGIATGFNKARWTILDANFTTIITALVLFEYGTGPIKGFAVTLSIGVVTSVFAALVITRLLFEIYPGNRHIESLSI
ncbi:MAG: protein translocase subunit SecD [Deltaproteobacteria bacterium]|nr:protein translocase subunit SecD [Deltaproteobacteria bacterium]MBW2399471.1 protein translocase subunit SecD [Deltaproteobacteria bacterium]